ncbi:MAG TPA: phage Gp37/Gp68 family protein [Terricaulis sp.]|nr:phage Gp37/Gp68 family protein [Terricaulis sp.]
MADGTKIEWAANADGSPGASWNPIRARNRADGRVGWFCVHASGGCKLCYAERINHRLGTGIDYAAQNEAQVEVFLDEKALLQPLRWKKPRTIFVCSMTDLFGAFVSDAVIDAVFAVMALCPQHTFIVLTKRSARMRDHMRTPNRKRTMAEMVMPISNMLARAGGHEARVKLDHFSACFAGSAAFPNVWLGVSAEDQRTADERIPDLLATPAAVRHVSCEPLLEHIDLEVAWHGESALDSECWGDCGWCAKGYPPLHNCQRGAGNSERIRSGLDWVIVGGESGKDARPMHPDWATSLRDQCATAGVPFFFKQWGAWAPRGCTPGLWLTTDGDVFGPCDSADLRVGDGCVGMSRVGKATAGRLLDGRTHDERPMLAHQRTAA